MSDPKEMQFPWLAELLRFTVFLPIPSRFSLKTMWESTVPTEPNTKSEDVRKGLLTWQGKLGENVLVSLRIEGNRVDWKLELDPETSTPGTPFSSIGKLSENLDTLWKFAEGWGNLNMPVIRLAFGAYLLYPVESRAEGYRTLARFIPELKIDPEKTSDLIYQINVPITSEAVEGLRINRLTRYANFSFHQLKLTTQAVSETELGNAARMELDINSDGDRKSELPSGKKEPLLKELFQRFKERANKGQNA